MRGIVFTDDNGQPLGANSPAIQLLHELGHKSRQIFDGVVPYIKDSKERMREEQLIVDTVERPASSKLPGEYENESYYIKSKMVPVKCPTCIPSIK